MLNLTLRQLRYFEALARHGHFGHAAATCSISQPALSVQIKELEEKLGVPVLLRIPDPHPDELRKPDSNPSPIPGLPVNP